MTSATGWRAHLSSDLARGFRATLPVALAVAPFGLAYGAAASRSMSGWQASLMSVTVFAGMAQFVAASMLAQSGAWVPILIACALINLRLVLLSASLAPHLRGSPRRLHPLLAHLLTDESFAVSMAEYEHRGGGPRYFMGSGMAIFVVWQLATLAGLAFGANLPQGLGLEFALAATLICLLVLLVRDRRGAGVRAGEPEGDVRRH